ncbi:MAG: DegT/DnrJ/EryC1/StrS aminotransferase family protein [Lachnospiraceae bacterium]|nr:DegT/DnrJ/EryC1/StrS aminotransferase family protein [Lachnospiraceae bacterium]
MEFRDLRKQYASMKMQIDQNIQKVLNDANFIMGSQVVELENALAEYVGVKHCITCANGTDALQLSLIAWNVGVMDAVFVPDFTFFSSGEVVAAVGATPIFVDVDKDTCNISIDSLQYMIEKVIAEGKLTPKVIISVDLFGQPAEYEAIRKLAEKYHMYILEDGAQGFGGRIGEARACSFGDVATTSFFPAKPLGCYGDGGAIFTNCDEWAEVIKSLRVHGKGESKYDNIRIGMNSRLDTIQASVLLAKLPIFEQKELIEVEKLAQYYNEKLSAYVKIPSVKEGYRSSWAQYTIQVENQNDRDELQQFLKDNGIPTAVYYQKPMHQQKAFEKYEYADENYQNTIHLSQTVLSLPFHPYMDMKDADKVIEKIVEYMER